MEMNGFVGVGEDWYSHSFQSVKNLKEFESI